MKDDKRISEFEDDGRVVADMSDIEPQPLLLPRIRAAGKSREDDKQSARQIDRDEKRILIKSALLAGLAVASLFAALFGIVILLIGRM